ncbi:MAG: UbiA family prenyltransferase [Deltaproteobacteria bacterium]
MDAIASEAACGEREPAWSAALHLVRFHIVAIAALAAAVFGWLLGGRFGWMAALVVTVDWFLLNFWNRLADVPEDLRNGVPGAALASRHGRPMFAGAFALLALSLALASPLGLPLLGLRLVFHLGGFAYSYRILSGWRRLKDLFLVKNLASGGLFLLSVLGYPLVLRPAGHPVVWVEVAFLAAFFLPLELTYELIYDLRDIEGDRAEGIPTLPVTRGVQTTRRWLSCLLAASAGALVVGYAVGQLRLAELVMLAAPLQQWLVLRFSLRGEISGRAAVGLTYLGAAQLLSYIGWVSLGLPLG